MSAKIILKNVPEYELQWAIGVVCKYIKEGRKECVYRLGNDKFSMMAGVRKTKPGTIVLNYWETHK